MTTLVLSEAGRRVRWAQWKQMKGRQLSVIAEAQVEQGLGLAEDRWAQATVTLGHIASLSRLADMELAHCAKEVLGEGDWTQPEKKPGALEETTGRRETG